jgi:UDP-N-acetylmuramyl pentapeptide phosphotransferase/UDP-N-acetylglucosamine-1-phosphate transferase
MVAAFAAALAVTAFAPELAVRACHRTRLVRSNFRGDLVPVSGGPAIVLMVVPLWCLLLTVPVPAAACYLFVGAGFFLVGLADDCWGDRADGGFHGHWAALRSGRLTTGAVKAVCGGVIAITAACCLPGAHSSVGRVVDALLIALGANAVNLLDVRPGRAQAGLLVIVAPSLLVCAASPARQALPTALPLLVLLVAVARIWRADAAGRVMMGDGGANLLGAIAGLAAAELLPIAGRFALVCILIFINVAAERVSFSQAIEETPWLRVVDRRLGVR